jgi:hypothetical protein
VFIRLGWKSGSISSSAKAGSPAGRTSGTPASFGFDIMRTILIAFFWFLLAAAPADAAEILSVPKPRAAPAMQGNGLPADCLEWTDGCRICARQKDGSDACSNIGIACIPAKAARCTRP